MAYGQKCYGFTEPGTMDLQQVKAGFQLVVACFVIRCGLVATQEIFGGNL